MVAEVGLSLQCAVALTSSVRVSLCVCPMSASVAVGYILAAVVARKINSMKNEQRVVAQ